MKSVVLLLLLTLISTTPALGAESQAAAPPTPFERSCAIEGRVLDAKGKPVSKAVVSLLDPATNFKPAPVKADKKGKFKFTELVQSTYRLQATAKDGRESEAVELTFTEIGVRTQDLHLKPPK